MPELVEAEDGERNQNVPDSQTFRKGEKDSRAYDRSRIIRLSIA